MSRSRKQPYGTVCCTARGEMKKWKTQVNRELRNELKNPDSEWGFKFSHKKFADLWSSPGDGKCDMGKDPRWTRK